MTQLDRDAQKMYFDEVVRPQAVKEMRMEFVLPWCMIFIGLILQKHLHFNQWLLLPWILFWALYWPKNWQKIIK